LVDKTGKSTKHEEDYYDLANRFYQTSLWGVGVPYFYHSKICNVRYGNIVIYNRNPSLYLLQSQWGGVHFMIRSTQLSQQRDCPMSIPRGSTGGGKWWVSIIYNNISVTNITNFTMIKVWYTHPSQWCLIKTICQVIIIFSHWDCKRYIASADIKQQCLLTWSL
jgi:hypothetical protein